jgi:hypothetical protein
MNMVVIEDEPCSVRVSAAGPGQNTPKGGRSGDHLDRGNRDPLRQLFVAKIPVI